MPGRHRMSTVRNVSRGTSVRTEWVNVSRQQQTLASGALVKFDLLAAQTQFRRADCTILRQIGYFTWKSGTTGTGQTFYWGLITMSGTAYPNAGGATTMTENVDVPWQRYEILAEPVQNASGSVDLPHGMYFREFDSKAKRRIRTGDDSPFFVVGNTGTLSGQFSFFVRTLVKIAG